jgi:division protein CdvB (Snf7/Vps24/ESCRT-III family)
MKDWEKGGRDPLLERIERRFQNKPIRDRISSAMYRLRTQQSRLELGSLKMQQRDKELFKKCVDAQLSKDKARASMYAEECAEIRKIAKIILQCQLAIERSVSRLEMAQEIGDLAHNMTPIVGLISTLRKQISGIMPEVSSELGMVSETLREIVLETGTATGGLVSTEVTTPEAQTILSEASTVAEQRMKEKFPEIPATPSPLSSEERTSQPFPS